MTLFASLILAAAAAAAAPGPMDALSAKPMFSERATAEEMLEGCRAMIPDEVEICGHINRRSRRGTEKAAYTYVLRRTAKGTELQLMDKGGNAVEFRREGRIADTDITWSDLTLDYLWWTDVAFDAEKESETAQGIICRVLLLKKDVRAIRVWIDKRTGAMLQAHELSEGKVVREMFCTSLKKFGERWAPKNIEVGPPGAKYRTKIVVEKIKQEGK